MPKWDFIPGEPPGIVSDFEIYCHFHQKRHKTQMVPIGSALLRFQLKDKDGNPQMGNAVDIHLYCPYCGASQLYGVAVSEEEWETIYEYQNRAKK